MCVWLLCEVKADFKDFSYTKHHHNLLTSLQVTEFDIQLAVVYYIPTKKAFQLPAD